MRQRVLDRDRHCRAPGCDAPVWRCDTDHDVPWPAGVTCECNLTTFAAGTTIRRPTEGGPPSSPRTAP